MKTKFLTLITLVAIVISTVDTASAKANFVDDKNAIILTEAANFEKIEVRGNVELFISNGSTDQVKVYNKYYSESALVQSQNGTLRISSYKDEKLVVWITVDDLRSISAYDNAQVKSFGKLSAIDLDVNLYNSASADLDLDAFVSNISISDRAKANLKGDVNDLYLTYDRSATVNRANLAATAMHVNNVAFSSLKEQQVAIL